MVGSGLLVLDFEVQSWLPYELSLSSDPKLGTKNEELRTVPT